MKVPVQDATWCAIGVSLDVACLGPVDIGTFGLNAAELQGQLGGGIQYLFGYGAVAGTTEQDVAAWLILYVEPEIPGLGQAKGEVVIGLGIASPENLKTFDLPGLDGGSQALRLATPSWLFRCGRHVGQRCLQ